MTTRPSVRPLHAVVAGALLLASILPAAAAENQPRQHNIDTRYRAYVSGIT